MMDKSLRGGRLFVRLAVVALLGLPSLVASAASWYWSGKTDATNDWFATDNADNTVDGSWWKGSSWCAAPSAGTGAVLYFNDGGTCVLSSNLTALAGKIFLDGAAAGTKEATVILDEGSAIDRIGFCISGPNTYSPGPGHLIVRGGSHVFGSGTGNYDYGLSVGCSGLAGCVGTAEISGGTVVITNKPLLVGCATASGGILTMTGGTLTVDSTSSIALGSEGDATTTPVLSTNEQNFALFRQTGGTLTVGSGSTITVNMRALLDVAGGAFTSPAIELRKGGALRWGLSTGLDYSTVTIGSTFDHAGAETATDYENRLEIVRGGAISTEGGVLLDSNCKSIPCHLLVNGGAFTNYTSYTISNPYALIEVANGGTLYVKSYKRSTEQAWNYAGLVPSRPYYVRLRGLAEMSAGLYACPQSAYPWGKNVIMEHVIEEGVTSPAVTRNSAGVATTAGGGYVPGNQRIRPAGGIQIVSTNRFVLMKSEHAAVLTFDTTSANSQYTSGPDETLWETGDLADHEWGSTLRPSAKIALARTGTSASFTLAGEFSARPMGYCELPAVRTLDLTNMTVTVGVAAPEGKTLEKTLADVKTGFEGVGYGNVTVDADASAVSFGVPVRLLANKSGDQKLLFDFTATPMPSTGMNSTTKGYAYPAVTNALLTSVSLSYGRRIGGLAVSLR